MSQITPSNPPGLLQVMREQMRVAHMSHVTEKNYIAPRSTYLVSSLAPIAVFMRAAARVRLKRAS